MASQDYRLNYRLYSSCANDVRAMCQDVRDSCDVADNGDICGGRVLRCLSTKMDDIKSPSCKWVAGLNGNAGTGVHCDRWQACGVMWDTNARCTLMQPCINTVQIGVGHE
jgi:hypothetical protein